MSCLPTELFGIVGTIDPIDANNADSSTDVVDMSKWGALVFIVKTGVIAASGTLDFAVYESDLANGGSPSAITGKAITQFTDADDGKQAIIVVRGDECTKRYVLGTMANSAHSQLADVTVLGFFPRYTPTDALDLSTVDEIVTA